MLGVDVDGDGCVRPSHRSVRKLAVLEADSAEPEMCRAAVEACVAEFGALDVLGNVAGIFRAHHVVDVTPAEYRQIMAVNIDAYFFLAQAAIPHLLERNGNIVNVASNSALQGIPYAVPYAISKGGVVQLTRALAVEFLKRPLRVNVIAPAGTNTNIAAAASFPQDMDPDLAAAWPASVAWPNRRRWRGVRVPGVGRGKSVTGAVYTIDNGLTVS